MTWFCDASAEFDSNDHNERSVSCYPPASPRAASRIPSVNHSGMLAWRGAVITLDCACSLLLLRASRDNASLLPFPPSLRSTDRPGSRLRGVVPTVSVILYLPQHAAQMFCATSRASQDVTPSHPACASHQCVGVSECCREVHPRVSPGSNGTHPCRIYEDRT